MPQFEVGQQELIDMHHYTYLIDMCSMGKVATTQWRKVLCDLDWDGNGCHYLRGKHGKELGLKRGGTVPRMSDNEKPRFVFFCEIP